jgi:hypothetical protein
VDSRLSVIEQAVTSGLSSAGSVCRLSAFSVPRARRVPTSFTNLTDALNALIELPRDQSGDAASIHAVVGARRSAVPGDPSSPLAVTSIIWSHEVLLWLR